MRKTKLKINRSLSVDTAALCDVAFLILVFFIATSKFKAWEPMKIDPPYHKLIISDPNDQDYAIIYIADNRVMYEMVGDGISKLTLQAMSKKYNVSFSSVEQEKFTSAPIIGAPITQLKQYDEQYNVNDWAISARRPGIPFNGPDNQLFDWIREARTAELKVNNKQLYFVIKSDKSVGYPVIKQIIATLQQQGINKFSLMVDARGHG